MTDQNNKDSNLPVTNNHAGNLSQEGEEEKKIQALQSEINKINLNLQNVSSNPDKPVASGVSYPPVQNEQPIQIAPPPSTIIISENSPLSKWFYILFILILVIFIAMTVIIVKTLMNKEEKTVVIPVVTPSIMPITPTVTPAIILKPTLLPTPTIFDSALNNLNTLIPDDKIISIGMDIKNTDFSPNDSSIEILDKQAGISP